MGKGKILDETIKHAEEVAEAKEREGNLNQESFMPLEDFMRYRVECLECASEHRQLVEYLKALREIWNSGDCNVCRNGQCKWKPELGQLVRYNCPHYVGVAKGEVNADEISD